MVDYTLQRRTLANDPSRLTVNLDMCDASPELLRAARTHGRASKVRCPACSQEKLTTVSWVYGDELKHLDGSVQTPEKLSCLADQHAEFTVYTVEVCRSCGWNHLAQSYVLGSGISQHPSQAVSQQ